MREKQGPRSLIQITLRFPMSPKSISNSAAPRRGAKLILIFKRHDTCLLDTFIRHELVCAWICLVPNPTWTREIYGSF